jgi:hypothetical protein
MLKKVGTFAFKTIRQRLQVEGQATLECPPLYHPGMVLSCGSCGEDLHCHARKSQH